jgi:hypothetical protein
MQPRQRASEVTGVHAPPLGAIGHFAQQHVMKYPWIIQAINLT